MYIQRYSKRDNFNMLVRPLAARLKKTWEKIFLGGLTVFQSHNKDIKLKKNVLPLLYHIKILIS